MRLHIATLLAAALWAVSLPLFAATEDIKAQIENLFSIGDWDRALLILQQVPQQQLDSSGKELLAMAYLYTSSRLDAADNYDKASALYTELVNAGGQARFFAGENRNGKPEVDPYLVEATPGQLVVTKAGVQFIPAQGLKVGPESWSAQEIAACGPN